MVIDNDDWNVPADFNFARDVVEPLAADPNRRALTHVDPEGVIQRLTFQQVSTEAARWAWLLRSQGYMPGDRVLVLLGKVPAWIGVMLGAIKGGLVTVPCSEMLRASDLAFRAQHSEASLLIADRSAQVEVDVMRSMLDAPIDVLYTDDASLLLQRQPITAPTERTSASDYAFILYTSGTTKEPKGVTHTHAYTYAKRMQAEHWLDARPDDLVWCTAGTGWAKSIWNVLLGPWSRGAEIVMHEGAFDPAERLELIERLGVTILCQSPTEYRLMAKLDDLERSQTSLRHAVSAGEPLNPAVIERFREALGLTIYDGYGQTENSLLVANTLDRIVKPGSMGWPTPGHRVAVIDEDGREVAAGVEGDIALHGRPPTLFARYWNAREETAAVFRNGWYLTGDRATVDEDGSFWFTGRSDDVILSAAYRIGPFEVESALLEHPAVAESAVVGKPHEDRGQVVKAFVVLRPGHDPTPELAAELQEHTKRVTAPYKYPREVEFVASLPKTRSGKIRRAELRQLELERAGVSGHVAVPLEETRRAVAEQHEADEQEARLRAQEEEQLRTEQAERIVAEQEAALRAAVAAAAAEERLRAEAAAEDAARVRVDEEARLRAEEEERRAIEEAERERQVAQERAEQEAKRRRELEAREQLVEEERRRRAERQQPEKETEPEKPEPEGEGDTELGASLRERLQAYGMRRGEAPDLKSGGDDDDDDETG
jgi:acyl-coenzyme A synthetase/AMP-(fatty) acid ligase